MEAIYEFEVGRHAGNVAADSNGVNAHQIGPDTESGKLLKLKSIIYRSQKS
ncbi:hypothetical protein O9993_08655 [Vibrio lentus]|nr:hypothetical protein [Vibrio lentus]